MFEGLFQPTHLIIILVIALIIFGPGKLSEVGRILREGSARLQEGNERSPDEGPENKHIEGKTDDVNRPSH